MELYSEALKVAEEPRLQAELLGNRCLCLMRLNRLAARLYFHTHLRYEEAQLDARAAVEADSGYAKGLYRLAICQKELSDLAGAWESATRASCPQKSMV